MTPKIWNEFVPQFSTKPVVNQVSIPGDFTPRFWKMETGIPE